MQSEAYLLSSLVISIIRIPMSPKKDLKHKLKDLEKTDTEHPDDFFSRASTTLYTNDTPPSQRESQAGEVWIAQHDGYEGQLAIDVYQDDKNLYIKAIIGGLRPEDVEVHLNNDMITIKGKRVQPDQTITPENYFIQECYWGGFSRSIILPIDIQNDRVEALTENGILFITLPKSKRPKNTRIPIKEVTNG